MSLHAEKQRRIARFRAIAAGDVRFPLRCTFCGSDALMRATTINVGALGFPAFECDACGQKTQSEHAHVERKNAIRRYLETGEKGP